jgi:hypothetical protein
MVIGAVHVYNENSLTKSISFVNWYETHEAMSLAVHPEGRYAQFRLASSKIEQRESPQALVHTILRRDPSVVYSILCATCHATASTCSFSTSRRRSLCLNAALCKSSTRLLCSRCISAHASQNLVAGQGFDA